MAFPIAAAGAAVQGALGLAQLFGGIFTKKPKRPEYEIQSEFEKNVNLAQGIKNMGGMDKASYLSSVQNIGRTQVSSLGQYQDRRGGMMGVGLAAQRSSDALLNLDSINARMAQQNFLQGSRMEMGANMQLGQEKKQKFQWDKLQPYLDKINQRNAMIGSGIQNIAGSGQSLALLGAGKDLGSIFGKRKVAGGMTRDQALAFDAVQPGYISKSRIGASIQRDDSMYEYDAPSRHF